MSVFMIQPYRVFAVFPRVLLTCSLVACLGTPAYAQWMWLDTNGSKVYSDRPPPNHIPDKNVLKRPANAKKLDSDAPPPAVATAGMPSPPSAKNDLDAKKKKADADAETKRQADQKAEEEKVTRIRAENCRNAQTAKAQLESGRRIRTTDTKGEDVVMDETMLKLELRRVEQTIQSECGPLSPAKK
jgi:type IV secretory pathway VirB10-like protein